jgi:hypothetical protein
VTRPAAAALLLLLAACGPEYESPCARWCADLGLASSRWCACPGDYFTCVCSAEPVTCDEAGCAEQGGLSQPPGAGAR